MSAQLLAVIIIVGSALTYLARITWKMLTGAKAGCGSGCGKCAAPAPPQEGRYELPQL